MKIHAHAGLLRQCREDSGSIDDNDDDDFYLQRQIGILFIGIRTLADRKTLQGRDVDDVHLQSSSNMKTIKRSFPAISSLEARVLHRLVAEAEA